MSAPIPIQYNGQSFGTLYTPEGNWAKKNSCTIVLVFHGTQRHLFELLRSTIQSFLNPIKLQISKSKNQFTVTFVPRTKIGKKPYPLFRQIAQGIARQIFLKQNAAV